MKVLQTNVGNPKFPLLKWVGRRGKLQLMWLSAVNIFQLLNWIKQSPFPLNTSIFTHYL